jgi:hypothetical protein
MMKKILVAISPDVTSYARVTHGIVVAIETVKRTKASGQIFVAHNNNPLAREFLNKIEDTVRSHGYSLSHSGRKEDYESYADADIAVLVYKRGGDNRAVERAARGTVHLDEDLRLKYWEA